MAMCRYVLISAAAVLALSSFAFAQDPRATVVTRSGERIAGTFDGIGNDTVYVRLSREDQRKLPMNSVLLIDFVGGGSGLPDTELSVAAKPEHLMLLRNGSSVTGRLINTVGGGETNQPHQVVFRTTSGEERQVGVDQVARIYLGNYPFQSTTSTATPGSAQTPSGSIRVPANQPWVPTNITVRRGDRVSFNVTGQVQLSPEAGDTASPAGSVRNRRAPSAPLSNQLAGALIGRVGDSAPFLIGDRAAPITMPAAGQLFLGVNDDGPQDNSGEFVVDVRILGGTRR